MQPQDSQLETLHQQASTHYLQGEFRQALQIWRELLNANPADERAEEGVRLCELLAEEDSSALSVDSPPGNQGSSMAPSAPFAGASEGFDDDLEDLDEILETGGADAPQPAASEAQADAPPTAEPNFSFDFSHATDPTAQPAATPSREPGTGDLDLGDLTETETLALGSSSAELPPIESNSHAIDLPPTATADQETTAQAAGEATEASASEATATELRSRVNELLAQALTDYEQGRKEEALRVLERIFILDEQNDAARALRENIQAELGVEQSAAKEKAPQATAEDELPIALAPQAPAIMPEAQDGDDAELDIRSEVDDFDIDEAEETDAEVPSLAEAAEQRRKRGKASLSKQSLIIVAAVIVVAAVGGGLAWFFMGRSGGGSEGEGSSQTAIAQAGGGAPVNPVPLEPAEGQPSTPTPAEAREPQPTDQGLDGSQAQQVRGLMAKARRAMDNRDYAGAVLAFNKVLELDPTHADARASLDEAGELYREQKSLEEQRRNAYDAFNRGNYRAALQIFYRLPRDEDPERLNRYMRNGWYNMGLQALRSYNCGSAVTNLKEAQDLDPDDQEVLLALDLAKTCRFSKNNQAFHDEVRGMAFRGLED